MKIKGLPIPHINDDYFGLLNKSTGCFPYMKMVNPEINVLPIEHL